ncbi:MAG: hypothetical protein RR595_05740 [Lysinibacillus sp.]
MKYKVLKPFVDSESDAYFAIGSLFSSSNLEREEELGKQGFLQITENYSFPKVDESLLAEAKMLKIKGYTKMTEENLIKAIEAVKAKKASEGNGE